MGTLKGLLSIANLQIGICESPPNSNCVRYNTWYYGREVMGSAYPWCMVFCQWVYTQADIKLPIRTASCTTFMEAAKKNNCYVNRNNLKPGDLVLFNFDGITTNVATHCGIVQSVNGSKLKTIEGNTATKNDTNGGAVMLRDRTTSQVVGAFRPIFEGDLDMTKAEFLKDLTDKEAYDLLAKALSYANKQKEPEWSRKEGHWASAIKKKIVDSDTPEGLMKRDELIAILGRAGLL